MNIEEQRETQRSTEKRKERTHMKGVEERDQGAKERPKKKFRQNSIKRYMNMDGKRKRKRDQAAHSDDKEDDESDNDNGRHGIGTSRKTGPTK